MPDGVKAVRMLNQNSSQTEVKIDPPQLLIVEGCTEFCPLDYFINYTRLLIPEDWHRECQLDKTFFEKIRERKVTIVCFLITVVMAVVNVYLLWRMYSHRPEINSFAFLFRVDTLKTRMGSQDFWPNSEKRHCPDFRSSKRLFLRKCGGDRLLAACDIAYCQNIFNVTFSFL